MTLSASAGRPVALLARALPGPRPVPRPPRGKLALRYWETDVPARAVSRAAVALAVERARTESVAFFCQIGPQADALIRDTLRGLPPDVRPLFKFGLPPLASGGAEELTSPLRDRGVSVVVIDNLTGLLPRMQWRAPIRQYEAAEREVLRELRRLISGFDRPIEVVLFHLFSEDKARKLLEEGFVDEIEELRL